ncbi:MAG: 50S ribosomal protein L23 [Gammaproteobacteria bacterium]|nr:50S ribosomal protein L23 [Gammaproteobacteria bacterium]
MLSSEIVRRPIITEKSMKLVEAGKYTFEVDKRATRTEVKAAVEELFNVKVESVNIINGLKKEKRVGRYTGLLPAVTKAIVTLEKGHKIEIFQK